MSVIKELAECCKRFAKKFENKIGKKYSKSDDKVYERLFLTGDEKNAIELAKQKYNQCLRDNKNKPSKMYPATTVHTLVEEIRSKSIIN